MGLLYGRAGRLNTKNAGFRPGQFAMYSGATLLWQETAPLTWNSTTTVQSLEAGASPADAHFFGGGMQDDRFSHKGEKIVISKSFNWGESGHGGGSYPYFLSDAGFGSFRNTWAAGTYDFTASPVQLGHNESRFDAYFFAGDFTEVLDQFTQLVGRPFLVPIYGLGLGDSDCYHNSRHGFSTRVVLAIADKYREMDMPGGWFLPNDGYGCGYGEIQNNSFPTEFDDLDFVVSELHKRGFYTGLWSSTGLPNIKREVAGSGTRIAKTDVGWIGNGGSQYTFDSVQVVADGIEQNSDMRRYIWSVDGWAGTHRNAVLWTGDDSGSWEFIRWQLSTFVGTGFSGMAHVSGDVDGIFGGSPHTYVRDLQFKCLMTTLMTMSGWAANPDKQPWTYGEPYTSINRMFLQLKSALTPYQYSYSWKAAETGVPPVRAMALQFPDDKSTYENHTGSAYQFMSGDWFLVAPVYRNTSTRDGIYLPAGDWIDFWDDTVRTGPMTLDGYDAPLDTLPLFVKSGAIVPMWPPMLYFNEKPHDPMTLALYPDGNTTFTLYEDDGITRAHEQGAVAITEISMSAAANFSSGKRKKPDVVVNVKAFRGEGFMGQLAARRWTLKVGHGP
jgi:alpha-glucosidase (family GH31 glycosyl hydrolase)